MKHLIFPILLSIPLVLFGQINHVVVAPSGLILRGSSGTAAPRLAKIPYGTEVSILARVVEQNEIKDSGKTVLGRWVYVEAKDSSTTLQGYVFDYFLRERKQPISSLLAPPDIETLRRKKKQSDYSKTIAQLYFESNYQPIGEKYDVKHYEWLEEGGICSFSQDFEGGFKYKMGECTEGGGRDEEIHLPPMTLEEVRTFIIKLFETPDNTWRTPYTYEPDGAGCYYEIKLQREGVLISTYCGC